MQHVFFGFDDIGVCKPIINFDFFLDLGISRRGGNRKGARIGGDCGGVLGLSTDGSINRDIYVMVCTTFMSCQLVSI